MFNFKKNDKETHSRGENVWRDKDIKVAVQNLEVLEHLFLSVPALLAVRICVYCHIFLQILS